MSITAAVRRSRALLLVGHGSAHDPAASAPVRASAQRIAQQETFDFVGVGFWKEPPFLPDALAALPGDDVFIVPMFLAEGYYTRQVVPRQLGLNGRFTMRAMRHIHYCRALGSHPAMSRLVLRSATHALRSAGMEAGTAALVIVGHGTERNPFSARSTCKLSARLHGSGYARIDCGFLDQEPRIERVIEQAREPCIVLVPYFLAAGWHTRVTIPQRLGLTGRVTRQSARTVCYAAPVGLMRGIDRVVTGLVEHRAARRPLQRNSPFSSM
jgi:sirohydrochlorin cobaltochelatase